MGRMQKSVTRSAMLLLNCIRCDDVVKLIEKVRICECGATHGRVSDDGEVEALGSPRVLSIGWEVYDGLTEGSEGAIGVLPRAQYRAKGSV